MPISGDKKSRRYFVDLKDTVPPEPTSPFHSSSFQSPSDAYFSTVPHATSSESDGGIFLRTESPVPESLNHSQPLEGDVSDKVALPSIFHCALDDDDNNRASVEYDTNALLGIGRYSRVVRGTLTRLGENPRNVAVKIFHNEEEGRISAQNEISIIEKLKGIPRVVRMFGTSGFSIMVLELAHGDLSGRAKILNKNELVLILLEISKILKDIHSRGIVHLDLKPQNILFTLDGHVLLADFGSAVDLHNPKSDHLPGTLIYTAPEMLSTTQIMSSPAADIYSFGAIIYCLLKGESPFQGGVGISGTALILAIQRGFLAFQDFIPDDDISRRLWEIMSACVERDPQKRPTAAKLVDHLQRLIA